MTEQNQQVPQEDKPEFSEPVNLGKKVRYSEKGIDKKKLQKAEEVSKSQLKNEYLSGIASDLADLKKIRSRLIEDPGNREAIKEELFQLVHKIRGQAGTFDYQLVSTLGDRLCTFLEKNPELGPKGLSVVNLCVDSINIVVAQEVEGDGGETGQEIVRGIDAVIEKIKKKQ